VIVAMACRCGNGVSAVLVRVAALAGVGIVIGMVHSSQVRLVAPEPAPPPVVRPLTPANGSVPADTHVPLGLHIALEDARRFFDEGTPFIDARPDHEYVAGTIPGAFHITPGIFSTAEGMNILVYIDPDKPVVIFCSGGDCHDSENLAALMKDGGYKAVHIFTDGFPAWQQANYEVDVPTADTKQPAGGA